MEKKFTAIGDSWIRSDSDTVQGGGTGGNITIGSLYNGSGSSGFAMRGLLSFDLSSLTLESNQTISSVKLVLTSIGTDGIGGSTTDTITLSLHALTQPFSESQSTWTKASTDTIWTTAGGSIGTALNSLQVGTGNNATRGEVMTWNSSEAFTNYATSCVGTTLNLILLNDTTTNSRTLANFASKDHGTVNFRPQLVIEVTTSAIPEPSMYGLLVGILALFAVVSLRHFR